MQNQQTIREDIHLSGVGLHSGKVMNLVIRPAESFTGIVFHRTDVTAGSGAINVCADAVCNTELCTEIKNDYGVTVSTIEHLMAAFYALGIDNAICELDGPEVPILDGSSRPFVKAIDKAGIMKQGDTRQCIKVMKEVVVRDGNRAASVKPAGNFSMHVFVHYGAQVPPQSRDFSGDDFEFRGEVCHARTFCMERDIPMMKENGLIKGGSADNAVIISESGKPVNEEGFRVPDEVICHKALDCMGDLYMSGYRVIGNFSLTRPGHGLNNQLLRAVLENPSNWKWV